NLDAIAGRGPPRLELAGDSAREASMSLVDTAAARIGDQPSGRPGHPSIPGQLIDLAFPFSLYEQAPFVGAGIAAVTLTTAGERPVGSATDSPERLDANRFAELGRAAQSLLGSLDAP